MPRKYILVIFFPDNVQERFLEYLHMNLSLSLFLSSLAPANI